MKLKFYYMTFVNTIMFSGYHKMLIPKDAKIIITRNVCIW